MILYSLELDCDIVQKIMGYEENLKFLFLINWSLKTFYKTM